ncbi:hypothetical protein F2P81_008314 [Scophthalmus maximus]|uniref:Uncharacterized protein n=1 Tax=Scophthalmus maximus TaxID=52904 RepID=A0A6A4T581_SCOMX|nr:hypothetical protein F2P81_008314 [Scophthalmus maximus]
MATGRYYFNSQAKYLMRNCRQLHSSSSLQYVCSVVRIQWHRYDHERRSRERRVERSLVFSPQLTVRRLRLENIAGCLASLLACVSPPRTPLAATMHLSRQLPIDCLAAALIVRNINVCPYPLAAH